MIELSNQDDTLLVDNDGVATVYSQAKANELFEWLREWRLNEAVLINLPAYCVLDDKCLRNIASILPADKESLWLVSGLAATKIDTYGQGIIDVVSAFLRKYNIKTVLYGKYAVSINNRNQSILGYLGLLDYFSKH
ncbi:MAG: HRDC domain-containing protein [Clostridiales bacterium]|nr:HRDC domain-containing protein [Clostridiales bacterium]